MNSHIRLAIIVLALIPSISARAQRDNVAISADVAAKIGCLIHFKQVGDQIVLDRDYWELVAVEKSEQEKVDAIIDGLVKQGIPEEHAAKIAESRAKHFERINRDNSKEVQLFEELKQAAGAMSGGSGGGGGSRRFTGYGDTAGLLMRTNSVTNDFEFSFCETVAPFRKLVIEDHPEIGLRIHLTSPEDMILFWQTPDGKVRVAEASEEKQRSFQVGNYQEMPEKQPKFSAEFWAQLDSFGISKILTRDDPKVISTVGEMIRLPKQISLEDFQTAIKQLGDDSYDKRKAAKAKITDNFQVWKTLIQQELEKEGLDFEAKLQLRAVVAKSNEALKPLEIEIKRLIEGQKLLNDREYLTSIVDQSTEEVQADLRERISNLEESVD